MAFALKVRVIGLKPLEQEYLFSEFGQALTHAKALVGLMKAVVENSANKIVVSNSALSSESFAVYKNTETARGSASGLIATLKIEELDPIEIKHSGKMPEVDWRDENHTGNNIDIPDQVINEMFADGYWCPSLATDAGKHNGKWYYTFGPSSTDFEGKRTQKWFLCDKLPPKGEQLI